jgi:cytochrome c-type biogenesis protein
MEGFEIGYAAAVSAGVLSFLSPCVLPLVPPYLCFLGGVTFDQLAESGKTEPAAGQRILVAALAFVLGFSVVFVAMGATASLLGQMLAEHMTLLGRLAGLVIIVMGLHFLGVLRLNLLLREARFHGTPRGAGPLGAFVVGLAFAFGWTPCVGPALATILFVAAGEGDAARGAGLLAAYALGIGIPFLLAAVAVQPFLGFLKRFRRQLGRVEQAMGGLLVLTGVLFLTGTMPEIAYWLLETFPSLGRIG